jgi:hypothetical protein
LWGVCGHREGHSKVWPAVRLQGRGLIATFSLRFQRHIAPEQHHVGKEHTETIASKHITLRTRITRLVRRTMCLSTTTTMHDLVIGLFIKR